MKIRPADYATKATMFPSALTMGLLMASVGLASMMTFIFLGASVILSMLALFAPMLLIVGLFSGNAYYTLDDCGLKKNVTPYIRHKQFNREKSFFHTWAEVKSFKTGRDMNRSYQNYEFLEITFRNSETWQLTDTNNNPSFELFKQAFLDATKQYNEGVAPVAKTEQLPHAASPPVTHLAQPVVTHVASTNTPHQVIEQKKAFYETAFAKVLFWLLLVFCIGFVWWVFNSGASIGASVYWRMGLVIVPGMGYLFSRIYMGKKSA